MKRLVVPKSGHGILDCCNVRRAFQQRNPWKEIGRQSRGQGNWYDSCCRVSGMENESDLYPVNRGVSCEEIQSSVSVQET